ncbi:RDD family protein [Actinocrinis puniceicyclus]|uniref:RDD family protein n=1 Tax=Actinocrinis puniceicyclus TaxID=977794 RepID=A0A8J8BCU3_9ACTN|nr:RDD family protein [Actinocrinis puniceicyclus]MBS2964553.1 RDD family protein [Actinocrinis puniceicyclus]
MSTGPEAGYYADPSIPGYIRYWDGTQWVPGTSRPAPEVSQQPAQPPYQQEQQRAREQTQAQTYAGQASVAAASAYEYDQAALQQSVAAQLAQPPAQRADQAPAQAPADQGAAASAGAEVPTSVATMVVPSAFAGRTAPGSNWAAGGSPFDAIPGLYRSPEPAVKSQPAVRVVELASAGSRILARIIDVCIAVVLSLPATVTLLLIAHRHDHAYVDQLRLHAKTTYRTLGMDTTGIALWAGALAVVLLTAIVLEGYRLPRSGQTTGRRLVGVQVVTAESAEVATGGAAAARAFVFWLLALIPLVDVLALGGILWGRPYRQGLHEKLSGTLSIRA